LRPSNYYVTIDFVSEWKYRSPYLQSANRIFYIYPYYCWWTCDNNYTRWRSWTFRESNLHFSSHNVRLFIFSVWSTQPVRVYWNISKYNNCILSVGSLMNSVCLRSICRSMIQNYRRDLKKKTLIIMFEYFLISKVCKSG